LARKEVYLVEEKHYRLTIEYYHHTGHATAFLKFRSFLFLPFYDLSLEFCHGKLQFLLTNFITDGNPIILEFLKRLFHPMFSSIQLLVIAAKPDLSAKLVKFVYFSFFLSFFLSLIPRSCSNFLFPFSIFHFPFSISLSLPLPLFSTSLPLSSYFFRCQ